MPGESKLQMESDSGLSILEPLPELGSLSTSPRNAAEKALADLQRLLEVRDQKVAFQKMQESALWWLRNLTQTFDKHWKQSNLTGPYNPFPNHPYFDSLHEFLNADNEWLKAHGLPEDENGKKRRVFVKSRDMMVSWFVVGEYTHRCQLIPQQEILFQSQNQTKANDLITYAKCLYIRQPQWLREKFPLEGRIEDMPMHRIVWQNGSSCMAIPQGASVINSYHPTAVVMDEAARQIEGGTAVDIALPAVGEAVLISSAFPGWFQEFIDADVLEQLLEEQMVRVA